MKPQCQCQSTWRGLIDTEEMEVENKSEREEKRRSNGCRVEDE